jgi:hypothetical protein
MLQSVRVKEHIHLHRAQTVQQEVHSGVEAGNAACEKLVETCQACSMAGAAKLQWISGDAPHLVPSLYDGPEEVALDGVMRQRQGSRQSEEVDSNPIDARVMPAPARNCAVLASSAKAAVVCGKDAAGAAVVLRAAGVKRAKAMRLRRCWLGLEEQEHQRAGDSSNAEACRTQGVQHTLSRMRMQAACDHPQVDAQTDIGESCRYLLVTGTAICASSNVDTTTLQLDHAFGQAGIATGNATQQPASLTHHKHTNKRTAIHASQSIEYAECTPAMLLIRQQLVLPRRWHR